MRIYKFVVVFGVLWTNLLLSECVVRTLVAQKDILSQKVTVVDQPCLPALRKVIFLFAHGLGGNSRQAYYYSPITPQFEKFHSLNDFYLMVDPIASFDFEDVTPRGCDYSKTDLGQKKDMFCLHAAYCMLRERYPDCDIVLVGVSRGAVTIINYMSCYKPTHIKALVLESPFDTYESIVKNFFYSWLQNGITTTIGLGLLKKQFPAVDVKGITPLESITTISHDVPILFIHSEQDELIPVQCSYNLVNALRQWGHPRCHLIVLPTGKHADLLTSDSATIMQKAVFDFFKAYDISLD